MDYIFVTLKTKELGKVDLKIPTYVSVSELLTMLSESINMSITRDSQVQAEPLGRILDNSATIEDEGITNGSLLTVL